MSNNPEASLDRACARRVKELGGWWLKLLPGALRGVPDRLLVLPEGRIAFVELKAPEGRVEPLQAHRIMQLSRLGQTVAVVRSLADLQRVVDKLGLSR